MLSTRNATLVLGLASGAMIISAWTFQYFGVPPCKMCYWQRYPHMAAFFIGVIGYAVQQRVFALFGAAAMAITGGIGVFHSGVERGFWEGPTTCTSSGAAGLSSDELFDQIMNAPLVRCDEIAWQMLGFTMPNLNALGSFALMLGWLWVWKRWTD